MEAILGYGAGAWPRPSEGFDLWLPVLVLLAFVLLRVIGGLRLTLRVTSAALLGGMLWAAGRDAFGVIPSTAAAVLIAFVAGALVRRVGRRAAD